MVRSIDKSKLFGVAVAATLLGLVVAACSGSGASSPPSPTSTAVQEAVLEAPPAGDARVTSPVTRVAVREAASSLDEPLTIPRIVRDLTPSVVHVQTEAVQLDMFNQPSPGGGVGTGEVIDESGLILTNNHVVEGADRIIVTLSDGRDREAVLIGGDPATDLAVIRIDADGLVPIPMGSSDALEIGDDVIAIGHALNLPGGPTVTGGLVSALDRAIDISATITLQNLIQTDAAINPGNSGGPLVNRQGLMVGVNTARIPGQQSIGFAIAIDDARSVIDELIEEGRVERGFLGASTVTITPGFAMSRGIAVDRGAGVINVAPGSPAEAAGLLEADIIVGAAGRAVANVGDLDAILFNYRSGVEVEIDIVRGDERMTVVVTLGERPTEG